MKRLSLLMLVVLSMMARVYAAPVESPKSVAPPKPTDCLTDAKSAAASAQYGEKTYYFKSQACKDEFLSDPERYSQLYDALLELKAQGKPLQKPKPQDNTSAVPS